MDLAEVKHEFECDTRLQCRTCLSVGRKLTPLGLFTNIYMKITAEFDHPSLIYTYPIQVCWECKSLLRKVEFFQTQVKKAQELLMYGQAFIFGSLSTLTTVMVTDTHNKIYLNDNAHIHKNVVSTTESLETDNEPVKVLSKGCKRSEPIEQSCIERVEDSDSRKETLCKRDMISIGKAVNVHGNINFDTNCMGDVCEGIDGDFDIDTLDNNKIQISKDNLVSKENYNDFDYNTNQKEIEIEPKKMVKKTKKQKSRWALKRAEQNKEPKFRIVSTNFDEAFTKIQINNNELEEYMARERDSEYYKSRKYKCEKCVFGYDNEKFYNKHNEIAHNKKNTGQYTCDICKTKIDDKRHLSAHIAQHYYLHKCTLCKFVCRNKEQSCWHFQRDHKIIFQCLKCELKFGRRREFFKHFKAWHERFICDLCGITFKMRYCIEDHIRKQHGPRACARCGRSFARRSALWRHRKLVHAPAAPPAYCVECDTVYKDIYRYKWHLCNSAKHAPKKKVKVPCPDCDKTFTKNIYMKDHYNLVHLKLVRYRCEECNKNFVRNAELVKHRRRTHEGVLPPRGKICPACGRGFSTNRILLKHSRTHAGERRHACVTHTHAERTEHSSIVVKL